MACERCKASLCDFATVVEASKEDDAVLVDQHAVPATGRGPALAGQLLPGPVFQIQPPQVLVVLEFLLYWHHTFLQAVRHESQDNEVRWSDVASSLLYAMSSMGRPLPALLLACRGCKALGPLELQAVPWSSPD